MNEDTVVEAIENEKHKSTRSAAVEDMWLSLHAKHLSKCKETRYQLMVRCGGLLEVWGEERESRIQYLHRTARGFIEGTQICNRFLTFTAKHVF